MPNTHLHWNSLSEFADYCEGESVMANGRRLSQKAHGGWHGTASFDEAKAIAFNWAEGVERIERVKARLSVKSQRTRKKIVAREAGPGVLSMGKFVAGHPQPYMNLEDDTRVAKGRGKVVKVVVNITASAVVDTEVIERRGAAMLAMLAAMEQAGKRVELTIVSAVTGTGRSSRSRSEMVVKVKSAQQKLNLNSVAFAVAHPSMLRRFMFAAQERQDEAYRNRFKVGGGYGRPTEYEVSDGTIYLGMMMGFEPQWDSEESASAWVRDTLAAQGINLR